MVPRARGLAPLLLAASLLLAGCTTPTNDADDGAHTELTSLDATRPPEPTGEIRSFDLYLQMTTQEIEPNQTVQAWAFGPTPQGPFTVPGPTIRVQEGDTVRITFHNLHNTAHTIHWHGLHVPWDQDGVPYVSQDPVPSGDTFTYEFIAGPAGTHMYHCHVDAKHHIDMGMYGLFIVEPQTPDQDPHDREQSMMLDEWDKDHIHNANGTGQGLDPTQTGNPVHAVDTIEQQARDLGNNPPDPAGTSSDGGNNPLQEQRDWYPVTYAPYEPEYEAYLINGKAFPLTTPLTIAENQTLKVRLANIGAMPHAMHLHGHSFLVTHKDGYPLPAPYRGDTLLIGPGERYDIRIDGVNPGIWLFHDHAGEGATSNHISPGGMMTTLVYDAYQDQAQDLFDTPVSGNYLHTYS